MRALTSVGKTYFNTVEVIEVWHGSKATKQPEVESTWLNVGTMGLPVAFCLCSCALRTHTFARRKNVCCKSCSVTGK